jgi:hypothetical protein
MRRVSPEVQDSFVRAQKDLGNDLSSTVLCQVEQVVHAPGTTCKDDDRPGFCYAEGAEARSTTRGRCGQAIVFTRAWKAPENSVTYLSCVESDE